jgi:hypothetical protein
MANKNIKKFYQNSDRQYNYVPHAVGHGAPTTIPQDAGLMYIDVDSQTIYVSAGKSNVSDWKVVTGGGGSSITLSTNGTVNNDQTALNLQEGTGIALTDNGSGQVTIQNTAAGKSIINLTEDRAITLSSSWSNSGGNFEIPITAGNIYSFRMFCIYNIFNTAYGTKWAVDSGTGAVAGNLGYYSYNSSNVQTSFTFNTANSTFNEPTNAAGTTFMGNGNIAIIEGFFNATENGFLFPSVANDGGVGSTALTLRKGSYIEYTVIPA